MAAARPTPFEEIRKLNGTPRFLGVIVATTTKNNADTAVPFNATGDQLRGKMLMMQADAACHVYFGPLSTQTATTANGVKLAADQIHYVMMTEDIGFVACVGAASLRIWELL
jgi:hypothetical protein